MKKFSLYTLIVFSVFISKASAQENLPAVDKSAYKQRAFKVYNPPVDKTDQFEIVGIGGTTFTASNTADGSSNSFDHAVLVVVTLNAVKPGNDVFRLNFYSNPNHIQ